MRGRNTILDQILKHKRAEVAVASQSVPLSQLKKQIAALPRPRPFVASFTPSDLSVIAEFKRASPSAGSFAPGLNPAATARAYEEGGAVAMSVLTDARYFKGSGEDLVAAREAVSLPVLRKDFIVSEYQIFQSRVMNADAILLIAAVLDEMDYLSEVAHRLGLDVLVEIHSEAELERAIAAAPDAIGINNRDLRTFRTDLAVTKKLRPRVPGGLPVVSESGISGPDDMRLLRDWGADAVLVGEMIVKAPSSKQAVAQLVEAGRAEPH